jgi:putative nucleotidyltransferase with HDIG domain
VDLAPTSPRKKQKKTMLGVLEEASAPRPSFDPQVAQDLLEKGQVETADIGCLAKLTPFGPVAIRLLHLFDRNDLELEVVARMVASEAALTSELLALVNSPLFGVQGSITEIRRAVAFLGVDRTRALAITLATRALLQGAPKTPVLRRIWKHSVATAVIAEVLAPSYGISNDLANTAAILHDLGRIGLLTAFPDQYAELAVHSHDSIDAILLAERQEFGLDHCQAGQFLSESWRFPPVLQQVAAHHLDPPSGQDVLSLVQTSCRLAASLGFAAVAHDHQTGTSDTIGTHVPPSVQPRVAKLLKDSDRQIFERIESLDF